MEHHSPLNRITPLQTQYSNFGIANSQAKVKVAVRIRPLLEFEKQSGHDCQRLLVADEQQIQSTLTRQKMFRFDQVFNQDIEQDDVYNELGISNMINKVFEGYHGTIFAYGQTGSGKTFTMQGQELSQSPIKGAPKSGSNTGITQRSVQELFSLVYQNKQQGRHYSIFCSFLQIYNEKVFDLLNSSSLKQFKKQKKSDQPNIQQGLRIRWTKKDQFVVENLYVFECSTPEEAVQLFDFGSRNRVIASHNLNDLSSRSHTIFTLTLESCDYKNPENVTVSKLQLVDLAGSEKQSLTGTTGQQAKESIDINKSLLVLRKVITALTEGKDNGKMANFIPYRESKLTSLLKQSLGGNSYTLMIACLSPSDRYFEENLSTLNYAAKASQISNIPTKNIDPKIMLINEQRKQIQDIENDLKKANEAIYVLTQLNQDKNKRIEFLEEQLSQIKRSNPQFFNGCKSEVIKEGDLQRMKLTDQSVQDLKDGQSELYKGQDSIVEQDSEFFHPVKAQSQSPMKQFQTQASQLHSNQKTSTSFFIRQEKEKQDAAAERLIHSVNAVTELLKANTELRDNIEKCNRKLEEKDGELFQFQVENQSLRERLELVEGILKNNRNDYEQFLSDKIRENMNKSNTFFGKFKNGEDGNGVENEKITIDNVYTELIQLRTKNRALEGRIKQLELQNFNITRSNFGQGSFLKNSEPSRPLFDVVEQKKDLSAERELYHVDSDSEEDLGKNTKRFFITIDEQKPKKMPKNLKNIQKIQIQHYQNKLNNHIQATPQNRTQLSFNQELPKNRQIATPHSLNHTSVQSKPQPDQRFYTKANFFTLKTNSNKESQMDTYSNKQLLQSELIQRQSRQNKDIGEIIGDRNHSFGAVMAAQVNNKSHSQVNHYQSENNNENQSQILQKNKYFLQPIHEGGKIPVSGTDVDMRQSKMMKKRDAPIMMMVHNAVSKKKFKRKQGQAISQNPTNRKSRLPNNDFYV